MMTARPQVELQRYELRATEWGVGVMPDDNGTYVKFPDYAALAARLAESEARAEGYRVSRNAYEAALAEAQSELAALRARIAEAPVGHVIDLADNIKALERSGQRVHLLPAGEVE